MTQSESPQQNPPPPKRSSATKWIAIVVVVIIIIAAVAFVISYHPTTTTPTKKTLSLVPTISGVAANAGTAITFYPGTPSGFNWTKMVWNFGDGNVQTVTSGNGVVTHAYNTPGSYLASVYAVSSNATASGNSSLPAVTINPTISPNPAAIFGPIALSASSTGNQTIAAGGWVNLTYAGLLAPTPLTVGSSVPGDIAYSIQSFTWNVDNGTKIINDNNTGLAETVNLTFSQGFHTVELTTVSFDSSTTTSVNGSYIMTVVAGNYSMSTKVPTVSINTQQLVNAEYVPGGPRTLDPALSYDTVSYEIVDQIYQPLIYYNGTSTSNYYPVIAKYVPSEANGGITYYDNNSYENITFYINTSIQFSNGDHVSAYDVWTSFARVLLFANNSATASWILGQSLLPALSIYGPFDTSFYWIHHAITYDNSTQSVTFHLLSSNPVNITSSSQYSSHLGGFLSENGITYFDAYNYGTAAIFFQFLAGPTVSRIMDASWLSAHGGSPGNDTATFAMFSNSSTSPSIVANWNQYVKNTPMGTGPYYLSLYEPAQEIIMKINPNYRQTQAGVSYGQLIPTIIIEYLTNQGTAIAQAQSGYAQFATGAFTPDETPTAKKLVDSGAYTSEIVTQMDVFFWAYNFDINVTGAKSLDSKFNAPASFFDSLSVRKAFSYAFNYSYWINEINTNLGVRFAVTVSGILPPGIANYPANISNIGPAALGNYSLSKAATYWNQTNYSKGSTVYHITVVDNSGNIPTDTMTEVWASAISSITGGKVIIDLVDIPFGELVTDTSLGGAGSNPMPIYYLGWIDDYPAAADFTAPIIGPLGIYTYPDGLDPSVFDNTTFMSQQGMDAAQIADINAQWSNISEMWNYLSEANVQPPTAAGYANVTLLNWKAETIDVNLFIYVGTNQGVAPVYYSSAINSASLAQTRNVAVGFGEVVYYALQYS